MNISFYLCSYFDIIIQWSTRPAFPKDGAIYCNRLCGAPRDGEKKTSRVRSFSHQRRPRQAEQLGVTNLSGPGAPRLSHTPGWHFLLSPLTHTSAPRACLLRYSAALIEAALKDFKHISKGICLHLRKKLVCSPDSVFTTIHVRTHGKYSLHANKTWILLGLPWNILTNINLDNRAWQHDCDISCQALSYLQLLHFLDGSSFIKCFFPFHTGRKRARKRVMEEDNTRQEKIEALLLETLQKQQPPPAPQPTSSEDELFLKSLVPSLERLSPQRRAYVKFQIHKLIYESSTVVLNLEPAE